MCAVVGGRVSDADLHALSADSLDAPPRHHIFSEGIGGKSAAWRAAQLAAMEKPSPVHFAGAGGGRASDEVLAMTSPNLVGAHAQVVPWVPGRAILCWHACWAALLAHACMFPSFSGMGMQVDSCSLVGSDKGLKSALLRIPPCPWV